MRGIYVADVDDGLCMAVYTISGKMVQIDCGEQKNSKVAFSGLMRIYDSLYGPDVFILSHFHVDHYNGLLYASINPRRYPAFRLREIYYPRIPEFREKEKFFRYLLTMNLLLFGSETGVMAYDFLQTISRMNKGMPFTYKPLSKGDLVNINGSFFEVLWPPTALEDDRTLSVIRRALEDFERALQGDEETRQLHDRVNEEGVFKAYFSEQDEQEKLWGRNEGYEFEKVKKRKLPEVVKRANKSLRKAANHLSLALFEDNRLLFLGDTESSEIKKIVDDLQSRGRESFYMFITPHHGTHWHNRLRQIRCVYSVTSNGRKLCSKMKPQFKEISKDSLATFVNSDIMIPLHPMRRFWRVPPWWFYRGM